MFLESVSFLEKILYEIFHAAPEIVKIVASSNKTGEFLLRGIWCWAACILEEAVSPEMLRGRNWRQKALGEENYEPPWLHELLYPKRQKPLPIVVRLQICTNCSGLKIFSKEYFGVKEIDLDLKTS